MNGLDDTPDTPLFAAVRLRHPGAATAIIQALAAAGANIDEVNDDEKMLMHVAAKNQSPLAVAAIIKALLSSIL